MAEVKYLPIFIRLSAFQKLSIGVAKIVYENYDLFDFQKKGKIISVTIAKEFRDLIEEDLK